MSSRPTCTSRFDALPPPPPCCASPPSPPRRGFGRPREPTSYREVYERLRVFFLFLIKNQEAGTAAAAAAGGGGGGGGGTTGFWGRTIQAVILQVCPHRNKNVKRRLFDVLFSGDNELRFFDGGFDHCLTIETQGIGLVPRGYPQVSIFLTVTPKHPLLLLSREVSMQKGCPFFHFIRDPKGPQKKSALRRRLPRAPVVPVVAGISSFNLPPYPGPRVFVCFSRVRGKMRRTAMFPLRSVINNHLPTCFSRFGGQAMDKSDSEKRKRYIALISGRLPSTHACATVFFARVFYEPVI